MASWQEIAITSRCSHLPPEGSIHFPSDVDVAAGRRLLVKGERTSRMMKPGVRADGGNAACVSGGALAALGGESATVRYRGLSVMGILLRDYSLLAQFAVSVLTLCSTVATAYLTFIKNSGDDAGDVANQLAFWLLAAATVVAFLKFLKEYREL